MLSRVLQSPLYAPARGSHRDRHWPPEGFDASLPRAIQRLAGLSQHSRCHLRDRLEDVGTEGDVVGLVHLLHEVVQEALSIHG